MLTGKETVKAFLRNEYHGEPSSREFQIFGDHAVGVDDGVVYQVVNRDDACSFLVYDTEDPFVSFNYAEDGQRYEVINEGEFDELFKNSPIVYETVDVTIHKIEFFERTLYRVYFKKPIGTFISEDVWDNIDFEEYNFAD